MRIALLLLLLSLAGRLPGQTMDAIYIKEHVPDRTRFEPGAFLLNYTIPELMDSTGYRRFISAIEARSSREKPPLQLDDCVYFADALRQDGGATPYHPRNLGAPPSFRFYTDRNKNHIDSLHTMQLVLADALMRYTQPFYFRKYEVTNAEYREFTDWVRDSVARRMLARYGYEEHYLIDEWTCLKAYIKKHGEDSADYFVYPDPHPLNWKEKVRWDEEDLDYKAALNDMYIPQEQRFYNRKEIDARKLIYEYIDEKNTKHVVPIYPDTLCWVNDFPNYRLDWGTNIYFWHPAYNNYPVVGVNYHQVKAFLHWKTKMEQQKLDAKGVKLKIEFALPTEIEWEAAAIAQANVAPKGIHRDQHVLADHSWLTDLFLDSSAFVTEKFKIVVDSTLEEIVPPEPEKNYGSLYERFSQPQAIYMRSGPRYLEETDTITAKDGKRYRVTRRYYYASGRHGNSLSGADNSFPDSYDYTAPADLRKVKKTQKVPEAPQFNAIFGSSKSKVIDNSAILTQLDANGISWMGGNVSEWIEADYPMWEIAFGLRLKWLSQRTTQDAQLEYKRELYFDSFNAKYGKLVRGANWFDERYSGAAGKNPSGTNAKVFVDPGKAHCTLGFRYVVHITQ